MANFNFYRAKTVEVKQRVEWIRESLKHSKTVHREIKLWIQGRCDFFESEISKIDKLIQKSNPAYLPRIKTSHILLEKELFCVSNYIGIMLREGPYEKKYSKVIRAICDECGLSTKDFLVALGDGPAISTGQILSPIFYVRDEFLASAYSWISLYHEIGHIVAHNNRQPIIESLVKVVRNHYTDVRASIGPVDQASRRRQESAIHDAERYWTEGISDIRLEELFCDCFATFACGIAYAYFWLDYGVGFVEHPKYVDPCDSHPPFLGRLESSWRVLPEKIKASNTGKFVRDLWEDYVKISYQNTNPDLEYGTVCHQDLICMLTDKCLELVRRYWPSLKQWDQLPPPDPMKMKSNELLASALNALVALLIQDPENYSKLEKQIIQNKL